MRDKADKPLDAMNKISSSFPPSNRIPSQNNDQHGQSTICAECVCLFSRTAARFGVFNLGDAGSFSGLSQTSVIGFNVKLPSLPTSTI